MAETVNTLAELKDELNNPHFRSYVFLGPEGDVGWKMAIAAQKILPALRVYRVAKSAEKMVRTEFETTDEYAGIVFGWLTDVRKKLTQAEASDFLTLTNMITEG